MMWFDYKKAFDTIPHDWLIESLYLAKVPKKIIKTIENLTNVWATKISLKTVRGINTTETIQYNTGLPQGDCLSLLLFILSINPLSHLLQNLPGYNIGPTKKRETKLTHLFFVDDLKTYAQDQISAKMQLDLITTFTDDIGMSFGSDKCAYINIERGHKVSLGKEFTINNIQLSELKNGESYKYLGQDEDIEIISELNKERVRNEYFKRIKKIWKSELYAKNKVIAHNIFAIPVITPTFGILEWTKDELEAIDIKTRKLLSCSGSFHVNSDIDRLYSERKDGGRGLNSVLDQHATRILSLVQHINLTKMKNKYIDLVSQHESDNLVRISTELKKSFGLEDQQNSSPKDVGKALKKCIKENHKKAWISKPQHGYLYRSHNSIPNIEKGYQHRWLSKSKFTSHVEGYIFAINV